MYSYPEIRSFRGLFLQANSFEVPDGALEVARNVVIVNDGIITKSRGYYNWFTPTTGVLNRLFKFQNTILAAYDDAMRFYTEDSDVPNEQGIEHGLQGEDIDLTGRVSRGMEANNNFYFTTNAGPLKLTSYNGQITKMGAPPGLDVSCEFIPGQSSEGLPPGQIVGYRVVFGYTDTNENLILGAPSDIGTIINRLHDEIPAVIVGSVIDASATSSGAGPYTITVTKPAHGLTTGTTLRFTDRTSSGKTFEGVYSITVTGTNAFTYSVAANPAADLTAAGNKVSYGNPTGPYTISVTDPGHGYTTGEYLTFTDGTEGYSQWEGTYPITVSSADTFTYDVPGDPTDDLKASNGLVAYGRGESVKVTASVPTEIDVYHPWFAQIYRSSDQAEDVGIIGDYKLLEQRALTVDEITSHVVTFVDDFADIPLGAELYTNENSREGILQANARPPLCDDMTLYKGFAIYASCTTRHSLNLDVIDPTDMTLGDFIEIKVGDSVSRYVAANSDGVYPTFRISQDESAAVRLRETAESIVRVINRDPLSKVYAKYVSLPDEVPGHMLLQAKDFTPPIYVRANSDAAGQAFLPALPSSFDSGVQVYSKNDVQPHVFFASKQNEPEAVPLVNFFPVGSKNKRLVRVHALRDSLILLKEDGIFRMTGDSVANFAITLLDSTVQIVASGSSDVINNEVTFLSGQGVCRVSESSVQIVSRQIKDVIQPILGQVNLASQTLGVSYESEQLYLLTTTSPESQVAAQTWAYCVTTDAWTSITTLYKQAVVGPKDTLYYMGFDNAIYKERKKNTKLDYTGQHYTVMVMDIAADGLSGRISLPDGVSPQVGDVLLKANIISRIDEPPVYITDNLWGVVFRLPTNIAADDAVLLYSRYDSVVKTSPFHAGLVGRMKQFSQMQIHMRDDSTSKLTLTFAGNAFGSSEDIVWVSRLDRLGWGLFAWGLEPWGQSDTINLTQGTYPAPIVRVAIPTLQSRNTYIQPYIVHQEAAEPLNFQAITYAVRAYGERVSR